MSKTLRIYLSAPMRGVEGENRPLFAEWAEKLRGCGLTVHSPVESSDHVKRYFAGCKQNYTPGIREFMAEDMRLICLQTDAVLVLEPSAITGAQSSRGCMAEYHAAKACEVPVLVQGYYGGDAIHTYDTCRQSAKADRIARTINTALSAP